MGGIFGGVRNLKQSGVHWIAPTTVILSLAAGIAFAVGHHAFYKNLAGKATGNAEYDVLVANVSGQQLSIAVGTALAFLVRSFLVMALATSYIQLFWREMAHKSREATLNSLDTTFSALSNILSLFKVCVWWRYPLLFFVATSCWLLPLAAIITPATLSVQLRPIIPARTAMTQVPSLSFVSLNYINDMVPKLLDTANPFLLTNDGPTDQPIEYFWNGPSRTVENIVQGAAMAGGISIFDPPEANSSWTLRFPAPALECEHVSDSFRSAIQKNIVEATTSEKWDSCRAYGFLAWTSRDSGIDLPLPFIEKDGSFILNSGTVNPTTNATDAPNVFYLAGMPEMMKTVIGNATYSGPILNACVPGSLSSASEEFFAGSTMIQCRLVNATYQTDFHFRNAKQKINITTTLIEEPLMSTIGWTIGSIMGPPLDATGKMASPSCSALHQIGNSNCDFDQRLVSTLSYQAIMQAFTELFTGSIYTLNEQFTRNVDSGIVDVALIDTVELQYLAEIQQNTFNQTWGLNEAIMASNGTLFDGILKKVSHDTNQTLIEAAETMFQNITVSLMTSRKLQASKHSGFAPSPVEVTFGDYHNVYEYSAMKLWIAYGIAISVTFILSLTGLFAIFANRASYSTNFSSTFRFARGAFLSKEILEEDTTGHDPLPEYLSKAVVTFDGTRDLRQREKMKSVSGGSSLLEEQPSRNSQDREESLRESSDTIRYHSIENQEEYPS